MDTSQCCLYCDAVQGCSFLRDSSKQFSPFRIIEQDSDETCRGWVPLSGPRQKDVRERLYEAMGLGSIRILYSLNNTATSDLKQVEEEEHEMMQTPDLASIIPEGMTVSEREHQLKFRTDEEGNTELDEDGEPVVRASYELRNFAISPDYHIQLDQNVGVFWDHKQVLNHIIKTELEEGLITKDSKAGSKNSAPSKATSSRETKTMATGKRVILRRGGKGKTEEKAPAKTGKAATTTKKTTTVKKGGKAASTKTPNKAAAPADTAAPGGFDMEALIDAIVPRVSEVVEARLAAVDEKLNEVIGYVEDTKATGLDAVTLLHDVMAQSIMAMNGNINSLAGNLIGALTEENAEIDYEPVEIELNGELFDEDNKILAYVPEEGNEGNE